MIIQVLIPGSCPVNHCGMAVFEDRQFSRDMQEYQINRARVSCASGHTTYVGDVAPPLVERRPIPTRREYNRELKQKQCKVCGGTFTPLQSHALYCPDPACKAYARNQREAARNTRLAGEGRNKSGWQKMSAESLKVARAFPGRRKPKEVPYPYADEVA